ncbi:DUF6988 family protein [Mitsuaria sp. TWR114]|uniref:DUF6988 family protein n=1 Tax=Mitsuaria sp. TWR114 TaxID=2601731 RepID=UPI003857A12E
MRPLRRPSNGYPVAMATAVIRQSNVLLHVAYRLMATLAGSQCRMDRLTALHAPCGLLRLLANHSDPRLLDCGQGSQMPTDIRFCERPSVA